MKQSSKNKEFCLKNKLEEQRNLSKKYIKSFEIEWNKQSDPDLLQDVNSVETSSSGLLFQTENFNPNPLFSSNENNWGIFWLFTLLTI